jgi:hypothetical protein
MRLRFACSMDGGASCGSTTSMQGSHLPAHHHHALGAVPGSEHEGERVQNADGGVVAGTIKGDSRRRWP